MPAKSKSQQRLMGMVHAAQMGETPASPQVAQMAKDMNPGDVKDFASTSQKGLPEKKKKSSAPWGTTGKISGDIKKKAF